MLFKTKYETKSINLPYFKFATQPGIEKTTSTVIEVSKYFFMNQ